MFHFFIKFYSELMNLYGHLFNAKKPDNFCVNPAFCMLVQNIFFCSYLPDLVLVDVELSFDLELLLPDEERVSESELLFVDDLLVLVDVSELDLEVVVASRDEEALLPVFGCEVTLLLPALTLFEL